MHAASRIHKTRAVPRALAALLGSLLISGLLMFVNLPAAGANENALTHSEPPASSTLASPPRQVTLNFRWHVQRGSTAVTVLGPDGITQWQQNPPGEVGRSVEVALRELGPSGRYEVRYQGLSKRGRPFQGAVTFTLAPLMRGMAGGVGSQLPLVWIVGVALLTVAGGTVGIRWGRAAP